MQLRECAPDEEYRAFFIMADGAAAGYILCDMGRSPVYLRQFYIDREYRRQGCGKDAFLRLMEYLGTDVADINVYVWNKAGIAFWRALGFDERYVGMRRKHGSSP